MALDKDKLKRIHEQQDSDRDQANREKVRHPKPDSDTHKDKK